VDTTVKLVADAQSLNTTVTDRVCIVKRAFNIRRAFNMRG